MIKVDADRATYVRRQQSVPMFYMPGVPGFGEAFAELRLATRVPIKMLKQPAKVASATPDAQLRLQAQLVAFFTRRIP